MERLSKAPRLPWPAVAASIVSFGVLAGAGGGAVPLTVLALALAATYLFEVRLATGSWQSWAIRTALYALVFLLPSGETGSGGMMVFDPHVVHTFGALCAAELVVQSWRGHPTGPFGGAAVFLSAPVFVAGCDTYSPLLVRLLAPVYTVLVVLALRSFRPRVHAERAAGSGQMILIGLVAAGAALSIGAISSYTLWTYRAELMDWTMGIIGMRQAPAIGGISPSPRLGPLFGSRGASARVLRIEGLTGPAHLRAAAFEDYRQGSWGPSLDHRRYVTALPAALHADAPGARFRITRFEDRQRLVFATLDAAGIAPVDDSGEVEWCTDLAGPVRAGPENGGAFTYDEVAGTVPDFQGPLCVPRDAAELRRCLQVPAEIEPGVRTLARRIGARGGPASRAGAVEQYLLSHYTYSLITRLPDGDPVSRFLLSAHSGHCQYFASSAVMLLRCLGVPARYVTGYYGHEIDSGGVMVVRQQDAHAWTEAWIDGKGWITIDATPADGRPDYTGDAVSAWEKLKERVQDALAAAKYGLTHLQRRIVIELLIALAVLFVAFRAWRFRRRTRAADALAFAYAGAGADLDSLARRFDGLLREAGLPCPPQLPWQEHLDRSLKLAAAQTASSAPAEAPCRLDPDTAAEFVNGYNAVRFGGAGDPEALERLRELIQQLEAREQADRSPHG